MEQRGRRRPPFGSQVLSVPRAVALFILLGASTIRLNILRWRYGHASLKRRLRRPTGRRVSLNTPTRSRWPTTCATNTSPLQEVGAAREIGQRLTLPAGDSEIGSSYTDRQTLIAELIGLSDERVKQCGLFRKL